MVARTLVLALLSTLALAGDYDLAGVGIGSLAVRTAGAADALDGRGFSPAPTAAPLPNPEEIFKRQANSDLCGFITSSTRTASVTCELGVCAIEPQGNRVGCCRRSSVDGTNTRYTSCDFPESCIDRAQANTASSSYYFRNNILVCSRALVPYCNRFVYTDGAASGYTQLGCGGTSGATYTIQSVAGGARFVTGATAASTTSSLSFGAATTTRASTSRSTGTSALSGGDPTDYTSGGTQVSATAPSGQQTARPAMGANAADRVLPSWLQLLTAALAMFF